MQLQDKNSDVTFVLTSCGRFDLLTETLSSFFLYNAYAINDFIIIDDSGNATAQDIKNCVPEEFREKISIIINKKNKGQNTSVDIAYRDIKTKYVFHCEDDWLFYRPGFIEESKKILENDKNIFSVWLRSYCHDLADYSGSDNIYLGSRMAIDYIAYYRIYSKRNNNQCFSFNPGLRHYKHYPKNGYKSIISNNQSLEDIASSFYENQGLYSVLLENDAVKHLGFGRQIAGNKHKQKRKRNQLLGLITIFIVFCIGFLLGNI